MQTGAILPNYFVSGHVGNPRVLFRKGRPSNKTFGPWLFYINDRKTVKRNLWVDAKDVLKKKTKEWPPSWAATDTYTDDIPSKCKDATRS